MKMLFKFDAYAEVCIMNSSSYKTRQRQAILDFLIANKNSHVTVGSISDYMEQEGTHIGVTTIYRHLDKLLEQGMVRKYTIDGTTSACFQYAGTKEECHEHFHLKCERCGRLIHLECTHVKEMCSHIFNEHGFQIDLFRTVFYGICSECAQEGAEDKE